MSENRLNRREALGAAAGALLAGCAVGSGSQSAVVVAPAAPPVPDPEAVRAPAIVSRVQVAPRRVRRAPGDELVNAMEYEEQAQLVLPPDVFAEIAGSDREPFNKMTLHQQLGSPTLDMNLDTELFGQTLFTPLIVGPIANLGRYHEGAEPALIRGASEAYTQVVVSNRSTVPFERLAGESSEPLWFAVYASDANAREQARAAVAAGARVVFITVAEPSGTGRRPIDWQVVDGIRSGLDVPVVVKGIATPAEAQAAVQRGVQGIVVSTHGAPSAPGSPAPIEVLGDISDTVAGRVPILVDGGFRRGHDALKGLILGARGVLIGRPAAWALAGYGSDGVRWLIELVQNELARAFGMLGVSTPAQLTRDHIRIHRVATE